MLGPQQILQCVLEWALLKLKPQPFSIILRGILAGAFMALGAAFFSLVTTNGLPGPAMKILGGLSYSMAIVLVVVAGAELFTANNLMVIALPQQQMSLKELTKNWILVYLGNLIGALIIAFFMYYADHHGYGSTAIGARMLTIAEVKLNLTWPLAFVRAILSNTLLCLAFWMSFSTHSTVAKIVVLVFPVTASVALGLEDSVSNMYFVPMGLMIKGEFLRNFFGFVFNNLIPVTLGNIIGGSFFVGMLYRLAYGRERR